MSNPQQFTELLNQAGKGDPRADEELLQRVYEELHRLARHLLARESGSSIQTTMLVDDAWMNLIGTSQAGFENRRHFFGAASQAMRRLLVDHARSRAAEKRGGRMLRITFQDRAGNQPDDDYSLLALHEALEAFEKSAPTAAQVVELRYFAGLDLEETAAALERSLATVKREWAYARAWLHDRLSDKDSG